MYTVRVSRKAEKSLRALPKELLARVAAALDDLAEDPRRHGTEPLTGAQGVFRYRVGGYRLLYSIEEEVLVVLLLDVDKRGDAYRKLRRLRR